MIFSCKTPGTLMIRIIDMIITVSVGSCRRKGFSQKGKVSVCSSCNISDTGTLQNASSLSLCTSRVSP
ncbi:hypothetical protein EO95_15025 [Methanosarcina sp. 1.H.T.1A.1]|nr:hypothetical protein EO95_15025 [Methanosarcina sp. 1.H.T.1A.1]